MTWDVLPKLLLSYVALDVVTIALALGSGWALRRWLLVRLDRPGCFTPPRRGRQFLAGGALAVVLVAGTVAPGWIVGDYGSGDAYVYENDASRGVALVVWALLALQSLFEELLFRAVLQALLALAFFVIAWWLVAGRERRAAPYGTGAIRWKRRAWLVAGTGANVGIAVLFGLAHGDNPNVTELAVVNIVLAGLVLGQIYWYQKSVWGAWGLHWVWNAGIVTIGVPVSGIALGPPLLGPGFTRARDSIWTGGSFGPEGSIASTVTLSAAFAVLVVLCLREARREPPPPPAAPEAAELDVPVEPPYQPQV